MRPIELKAISILSGIQASRGEVAIFLSAERDGLSREANEQRTAELKERLASLHRDAIVHHYQQIVGRYNGVSEDAFLVVVSDSIGVERVTSLARHYSQESVLLVEKSLEDGLKHGTLHFLDNGERVNIGAAALLPPYEAETAHHEAHSTFIGPAFATVALVFVEASEYTMKRRYITV